MQNVINLTQGETGANLNRVRWAQALIEQLAPRHDGRDSWLLSYGVGEKYQHMRDARNLPWSDFYQAATTQPSPAQLTPAAPIPACYECGRLVSQISSRGRCVFCEEKRANANANENDQLRAELADALTAKGQVEALREALDVANQEIKRLESAPKVMRGELVFKVGAEATRACLADVLRRVEQMEAEADALAGEKAESDHLVERLRYKLEGALKGVAALQDKLAEARRTIEPLKAEKDELQAKLDRYKKWYTSAKVMQGSVPEGLTVGEVLLGCGVGVRLTAEQSKELSDKIAEIKADRDKWAGMVKKAADAARQIIEINLGRYGVDDDQKKG